MVVVVVVEGPVVVVTVVGFDAVVLVGLLSLDESVTGEDEVIMMFIIIAIPIIVRGILFIINSLYIV